MSEGTDRSTNDGLRPTFDVGGVSRFSQHPIWDLVTKIAAPAALIISAASYLTGYTYRLILFAVFGFDLNVMELSVQNTISLGYLPLALSVIFVAGLIQFLMWIPLPIEKYAKELYFNIPEENRESFVDEATRIYKNLIILNIFNAAAFTMFCGAIAGGITNFVVSFGYIKVLNSDCPNSCMRINTSRGHFDGLILAQSKDTSLAVSKTAAYLLPNSAILSVSPAGKRRWNLIRD